MVLYRAVVLKMSAYVLHLRPMPSMFCFDNLIFWEWWNRFHTPISSQTLINSSDACKIRSNYINIELQTYIMDYTVHLELTLNITTGWQREYQISIIIGNCVWHCLVQKFYEAEVTTFVKYFCGLKSFLVNLYSSHL